MIRAILKRLLPESVRATLRGDVLFVVMSAMGHVPSARVRTWFYRHALGARIAPTARINGRVEIRGGEIDIGEGTVVGHDCILDGRGGLRLGRAVNLSSEAAIWTYQHDPNDPDFLGIGAPVVVGDRAWLSFRCTVLPGVTIGEGAIVAANTTVTRDVEPFAIVAGIPAVKIGERSRDLRYPLGSNSRFI